MAEELFEGFAEHRAPAAGAGGGRPRLREPERGQIELRALDLDSLIGSDHPARLFWVYVERLDLSVLEDRIKARAGRPGHPPISPRLLLALWLYATSQGVGSARLLAALCERDDGYRWLAGGVSVNYHTLSDFRVDHPDLLDRLLVEHVAALVAAGVIDLDTLAQDGLRVRAGAGASSFRRRDTVARHLDEARALVGRLKQEVAADAAASQRRRQAAEARAARERAARLEAALTALVGIEARRAAEAARPRRRKAAAKAGAKPPKKPKPPRASTTDVEATVMKMADGGFRPAYNLQIVSVAERQIVVAVEPLASGSDGGLMRPMLERVEAAFGRWPERHLADGGFTKNADIEWAYEEGRAIAVHCPPIRNRHKTDPFAPRASDGPGVLAWRRRMASDEGKAAYRRRGVCECIHARWRHWNLNRFTVRGRAKVRTVSLWFALANNLLQGQRLIAAA
ncbi:IS1182 family transposase [Inquilinus sp. CAU 1745]|uniref:IS1182 family transposase n=1 Tax=Inquilinus sp. CAU 1745 TaxID=3140369 RepID=UPI00325B5D14